MIIASEYSFSVNLLIIREFVWIIVIVWTILLKQWIIRVFERVILGFRV